MGSNFFLHLQAYPMLLSVIDNNHIFNLFCAIIYSYKKLLYLGTIVQFCQLEKTCIAC